MTTRQRPTSKASQPIAPVAPSSNGNAPTPNRTAVLTVYADGTMLVAPELTQGDALQIAEMIRRAVLSQPLAPRQQQALEPIPA